ncbi:unnamed protein product [Pieris brassicae]|uniref:Uncharacterized protein n=1 Tax=Pieris brassicae TaxID=7116 RepID=A0A9P0SRD3_PIEBR|nr:unnamed protein product [Pieris brassicae]
MSIFATVCVSLFPKSEAPLVRCAVLRRRCVIFHIFFITCPTRSLRRRARCLNGSTDKRRSEREGDALRCRSAAATTDSDLPEEELDEQRSSVAATLLRCDIVRRRNAGVAYNALFRYDDATQRTNGASL